VCYNPCCIYTATDCICILGQVSAATGCGLLPPAEDVCVFIFTMTAPVVLLRQHPPCISNRPHYALTNAPTLFIRDCSASTRTGSDIAPPPPCICTGIDHDILNSRLQIVCRAVRRRFHPSRPPAKQSRWTPLSCGFIISRGP
jgi:hypothetical protein